MSKVKEFLKTQMGQLVLRVTLAAFAAFFLLIFLAALRHYTNRAAPTLSLHALQSVDPAPLPAPPPPTEPPPPPPPSEELPRLDLTLDPVAPPIRATIDQDLELRLPQTNFAPAVQVARETLTFASNELDAQPKLINRPSVTFPPALLQRGVREGKVTLEIVITSGGTVDIRRTLESSHTELIAMARSFASRARFTPPLKDGRPVNALFKWPLILRP